MRTTVDMNLKYLHKYDQSIKNKNKWSLLHHFQQKFRFLLSNNGKEN